MGAVFCCLTEPVDFDGEVNLFHFDLHRAVGKGAFGKVCVLSHRYNMVNVLVSGQSGRA